MSILAIIWGIVSALAINETSELSPWAARKIVRWSARVRYSNPETAEARGEELAALIDARPGKLFKLFTALWFAAAAIRARVARAIRDMAVADIMVTGNGTLVLNIATSVSLALTASFAFYDASAPNVQQATAGQAQSAAHAATADVQPNLVLSSANYCEWRTGSHSMPLASASPLAFFIDNRCIAPVSADPSNPAADFSTGIHNGTELNDPHVTDVRDGDKVFPLCWTPGGGSGGALATSPPAYVYNNIWLKVRTMNGTVGYLPDSFTAGGSYSRQQLINFGVARCS